MITPTEYFCISCEQLRLNLAERTTCGNCGSSDIIHGKIGELDKESLKKEKRGIVL